MNTIQRVLQRKLAGDGISYREAARQLGVSHVTLYRIRDGLSYSLETANKIADWAGVSVSDILDVGSTVSELATQIEMVLRDNDAILECTRVVMDRILSGDMEPEQLGEWLAFARWRISLED